MTLIDMLLSELVFLPEVVDNMSHCGGTRCVLCKLVDFGIIIAAVICSGGILVFVGFCSNLSFHLFLKVSRSLYISFCMCLLVIKFVLDTMHENLIVLSVFRF